MSTQAESQARREAVLKWMVEHAATDVTITEIADGSGMDYASAHRYVQQLIASGDLAQVGYRRKTLGAPSALYRKT